ncbi:MAG: glutamyl-tRNA reductase [Euryarchaeota archaeon]|nr:glutamyl-tRNA reductase [Euryarchaeota archaeon]
MHTINVRVTHKKADIPTLEAVTFPDVKKALEQICDLPSIKEAVILQTCNRIEVYVAAEDVDVGYHELMDYMMRSTMSKMKEQHAGPAEEVPTDVLVSHVIEKGAKFHDVIETDFHANALHHLLRLTSGLESMIVGEDQILGQVKDAYALAKKAGTTGPFFENIFTKAIHVGQVVRKKTRINEGAVSIGSAAVDLAASVLSTLEGRTVLLVGAGEMGTLIAKCLSDCGCGRFLVANRTFEKAEKIAGELGGEAVPFDKLTGTMADSDVVITATGASRAIIHREMVEEAMEGRGDRMLVMIDVAIPRDITDDVGEVPGVRLFNIDGLREIAEENRRAREMEAAKVEEIIEEELSLLTKQLYRIDVEDIVKALYAKAEEVRQKEMDKALRILGNSIGEREKLVLADLTKVIQSRTISPIADEIRKAAEVNDREAVDVARRWFLKEK